MFLLPHFKCWTISKKTAQIDFYLHCEAGVLLSHGLQKRTLYHQLHIGVRLECHPTLYLSLCMCKDRVKVLQQVTSPGGQETRMAVYPKEHTCYRAVLCVVDFWKL